MEASGHFQGQEINRIRSLFCYILPQNIWFLPSLIRLLLVPLWKYDKMEEKAWKKMGRYILKDLEDLEEREN